MSGENETNESRVWKAIEARLETVDDEKRREQMRKRLRDLHDKHPGASVMDLYLMAGYV